VLVESNPVIGMDGAPSGTVLVLRDLTERRRLQEVREDLVMRVSHELRTPLTTTKGFLETVLAKWDLLEDVRRRRLVSHAFSGAERLDGLMNALLWRARIEANELDPDPRTIELDRFVAEQITGSAVPHAEIAIDAGTDVHADPAHLKTVLDLLLENAARYGAEPISVSATLGSDGNVILAVDDDGPGVPRDFVDELFVPFAQASTGTRRSAQGLGVGLSIAYALVQRNNGRLEYEPRDRGARFVVRLPSTESMGTSEDPGGARQPHRSRTPSAGADTTTPSSS
ncbi:MAG: HAMP domain-containing sensor histidine kinase, partial [Nitriliruptorales bacterium]|nr:HAMP domain-containing sensor histidine kinase [Nitriliruptorales bacterium]